MNEKGKFCPTCPSTHGGSGYAAGSYWSGSAIICGLCGYRIENPYPTGGRHVARKGIIGRIFFWFGVGEWVDTWPDWIGGRRGA